MQWRCGFCFLAFTAFFGVNLLSEELLRMDGGPRQPSHSFSSLRAQPSAELFRGTYALRFNASAAAHEEFKGSARMTLGSQHTSVQGLQVASIAIALEGAQDHLRNISGETATKGGGRLRGGSVSSPADLDLVLRGVEFLGAGRLTASGVSAAFGSLRRAQPSMEAERSAGEWKAAEHGGPEGAELSGQAARGDRRPCYIDALLTPPVPMEAAPAAEAPEVDGGSTAELVKHADGFAGHAVSTECGFSLSFSVHTIDMEHIGNKVFHYALWVGFLTLVQMWCFISQMRYTDEGPSAARLSTVGITLQALMDAYDSFLHLSLTASSQYMFNTFAMISLCKFVLFSLLEVRYVLTIWRCQHREVFAEGWDEVRRHVSRFHSHFHGTLFAGLVIIFNCLDYLDVLVLLFQAYWVPQIVYDVWHGSKASLRPRFLLGISASRSLSLFYLWGCPATVFSGDLYPILPRAPNKWFCIAVVLLQAVQLAVMLSQQAFGPRWFVPRAFLPNVYNYQRVPVQATDECVICMGELGTDSPQASAVTPCDHIFHSACLETWMDIKMECPTCRAPLPPMS